MPEFGLVGGSYQSEALSADCQDTINLYPEAIESGTGRAKYVLLGTPGTQLFCTLPTSPCRGMYAGDGRLFVVAGSHLYEVFANGTYTDRSTPGFSGSGGPPYGSTVGNDGLPVDMAVNGLQLLIVSAGNVYCDSGSGPVLQYFTIQWTDLIIGPGANQVNNATGNAFTSSDVGNTITFTSGDTGSWNLYTPFTISSVSGGTATLSASAGTVGSTGGQGIETLIGDGPISARHCAFLDGYFLVSGNAVTTSQTSGPKSVWMSGYYDGRIWDATLFQEKAAYPDNIARILNDHEELWLFGDNASTEVWRNIGQSPYPFQRDPGAVVPQAAVAEWSPVSVQNGVAWLGGDTRGQVTAWFATGFQPVRISNHAIEKEWSTYSTCADAIGYNYAERGHSFWVLTFPTANVTWCWDALTNMWHRRGVWNGTSFDRQLQAYHGFEFGKHYVCSYSTGKVYWMDKSLFADDGAPVYIRRTAPYIASELDRFSIDELRLDYKYDPALTITLAASYNGGNTWTAEKSPSGLKVWHDNAASVAGAAWRRQGQSRARLFRLTGYGAAPRQLVNAYINPQDG